MSDLDAGAERLAVATRAAHNTLIQWNVPREWRRSQLAASLATSMLAAVDDAGLRAHPRLLGLGAALGSSDGAKLYGRQRSALAEAALSAEVPEDDAERVVRVYLEVMHLDTGNGRG